MSTDKKEEFSLGMTLMKLHREILKCLYHEVDEKGKNVTFVISTDDLLKTLVEVRDSMKLGITVQEKHEMALGIIFDELSEKIKEVIESAMIRK